MSDDTVISFEEEAKKFKESKQPKRKTAARKPAPQSGKNNDLQVYAAAALSGLIAASRDQREVQATDIVDQAFNYADLMLEKQSERD